MTLNPLRAYFDYRTRLAEAADARRREAREERQADRLVLMESIAAMTKVVERTLDAQTAQTDVMKGLLDSFKVSAPPTVREFDIEQYDRQWAERHAASRAAAGISPLVDDLTAADLQSRLGEFSMMLSAMDNV